MLFHNIVKACKEDIIVPRECCPAPNGGYILTGQIRYLYVD